MSNLKSRLTALETLAASKLVLPVRFFRYDGTAEQAEEIAELNRQGVNPVIFTRAIGTDQP